MKNNTINKKEIEKFSSIAEEWWDPTGKFKPLHKFNPVRISYIKNNIIRSLKLNNNEKPLKKVKILDIGCGGGLLTEPMKKLGADVVGIDASEKNIKIAKLHSKKNNLDIRYLNSSPEQMDDKDKFDVILNLEIVEHVNDINLYQESNQYWPISRRLSHFVVFWITFFTMLLLLISKWGFDQLSLNVIW